MTTHEQRPDSGHGDAPAGPDEATGTPLAGPAEITEAGDFAAALTALRIQAGRTIREMSRETGIPTATLGGYFSGRHLPPPTQPHVLERLLTALGVAPAEHAAWRAALLRVRKVPGPRASAKVQPYRGLESYDVDDADWFVGRDDLVEDLHRLWAALRARQEGPRLITVVGASGSGKSSLLRAGLMARVRRDGGGAGVLVPGEDPASALEEGLRRLDEAPVPRVLVVDQFEEVFSERVDAARRERFLGELVHAAALPDTVVAVSLRADFYANALAEPLLLPLLRRYQVLVGPLDREALRVVVTEPASRAGGHVEPALVDLLLRDVAPRGGALGAGVLPLVSHALLTAWARSKGGQLTAADYVAIGGVAGAVQRTAEGIYRGLAPQARLEARRLFGQLVTADEEGMALRRRLHHADLETDSDSLPEVVEAFVAGRILTATENTLEISHEVLLTAWPRLAEWIDEDRELLLVRRRVGQAAAVWEADGREDDGLLRGSLLVLAEQQVEDPRSGLTLGERDFVRASLAQAAARQERERRGQRRLRALSAGVALLALATSGLSVYLGKTLDDVDEQRRVAVQARNEALSRQVAIQATRVRETDPALSAQLALGAHRLAPTVESRSALLDISSGPLITRLVGPEGTTESVATPDGETLVSVHSDGVARLWDRPTVSADLALTASTPTPAGEVAAVDGGELYAAAVSADGSLLAVAGGAGVVTLVDLAPGAEPRVRPQALRGPGGPVFDLAFAQDGRTLYAASGDAALYRWRLDGRGGAVPSPLPVVDDFEGSLQAVAPLPAGAGSGAAGVVTAGADGVVRVWREAGRRLTLRREIAFSAPGESPATVRALSVSPDGRLVAAGGTDKTVRVWDVGTGRRQGEPLTGFASWVNAVAFSANGGHLAAVASGGLLQVWRTGAWSLEESVPAPANHTSVAFLPGDEEIMTGSLDGVTRIVPRVGPRLPAFGDNLWGVARPGEDRMYVGIGSSAPGVAVVDLSERRRARVVRVLRGPDDAGTLDGVVAVAPDGALLVAGTSTGNVVVWRRQDSGALRLEGVIPAASALVENAAFDASGTTLVVSSDDGTARVLDVPAAGLPSVRATVSLPEGVLALGVGVSPDGTLLAVGGSDSRTYLYADPRDGAEPASVLGGFENYVYGIAFTPDGSRLAAGSADGSVRLWDVTDPSAPVSAGVTLRGPGDTVFAVAFDPSGRRLAAASQDGRVWVWNRDDNDRTMLVARLDGLGGPAYQVAFSPDGTELHAVGAEGRATGWLLGAPDVRDAVCALAGTPVTATEWDQYVPGAAYDPPCTAG